ncbi:RNase adapter RapZ [Candidatus Vallotia lariciata]|uniref:RapZ C-terminal domain-containing protein n=1 Tax=Candidatus Vallotia laricis TaxID=2018052 RepID=UPI001D01FA30|nr:RNase adapter RapZ [Candidatus Vallotia lariciata]
MTLFLPHRQYLSKWLPYHRDDNCAYLTISIGCTGGRRHRSVYIAKVLAERFVHKVNG